MHPLLGKGLDGIERHRTVFAVHDVVSHVAFAEGLEGACAHVQGYLVQGRARTQVCHQRRIKMQSCRRSRHRTGHFSIDGLVIFCVLLLRRTTHVRWQRHFAHGLQQFSETRFTGFARSRRTVHPLQFDVAHTLVHAHAFGVDLPLPGGVLHVQTRFTSCPPLPPFDHAFPHHRLR